jgi:hypothetical protein
MEFEDLQAKWTEIQQTKVKIYTNIYLWPYSLLLDYLCLYIYIHMYMCVCVFVCVRMCI